MGTEETQQAETTLDDELRAAWEATEPVEEEETQESTEEESKENSESEEEETAPEEEAGGDETESEDSEPDEGEAEEDEPETPAVEAPHDWPKEWAEKFRQLPDDDTRQVVLDQYKSFQADYTRKTQEIAEIRKAVPDDIKQQLDLRGVSEGQYLKSLTAADQYLSQNPQEGIRWLMQQYGVDPSQVGVQQSEDDIDDPTIAQLKQKVSDLETRLQQSAKQQEQSQQQAVEQQVQTFATETDEKGHLKHPHFETVKAHMGALMNAGAAKDMEDAYSQAVWANPELRNQLLEEEKRQVAQKSESDRRQKASKAKKAATPESTGTTETGSEEALDLRSELEKQFDSNP